MPITLDNNPVIDLDLHLPLNGAWSAEVQVASDTELAPGDVLVLALPGLDLNCRVVRAGIFAGRLRVRLTGGSTDWSAPQEVRHYRETTVGAVLADVDVDLEVPDSTRLPYWTRAPGTTGSTVQALATHLGVNWRVNPNETVRMSAEAPAAVDTTDLVEVARDAARGLVEAAPEFAVVLPGVLVGEDSVGDVLYRQSEDGAFRVRYYTEARARLRHALERVIRWVMRDTLFLGLYTAQVIRQAADGSLDLLPTDDRLRAQGLQAVPIRHGLPGVTVQVPAGELILLGFDAGDPAQPYAALWHSGQATKITFGNMTIEAAGTKALALAQETKSALDAIQSKFDAHIHITTATVGLGPPGTIAPPTSPIGPISAIATTKLFGA
jgi:hypothetical protein